MKPWALPLLLGAVLVPLALLAQQQPGILNQGQPQPLGQGYVLQGQDQQQDQTQQQIQNQQQGESQQQTESQQQQGSTQQQDESQQTGATEQQAIMPTTAPDAPPQDAKGVSLEGLDKITARTFAFDAPLNETVRFGYLEITARRCLVSAEEEAPERAAFLEVVEAKPGRNPSKVFSGWMFASSPSVSAMEHAVYDIWVVDCRDYEGEVVEESVPTAEVSPEEVEAPVDGVERPLD